MAHFGLMCPEFPGHLFPVCSIGAELVARGHRVTVLASARCTEVIARFGLEHKELPYVVPPHVGPSILSELARLVGARFFVMYRNRLCLYSKDILKELPPALDDLELDGLLIDQIQPSVATVAQHMGIPYVTICTAVMQDEDHGVPPSYVPWAPSTIPVSRLRNRVGYAGMRWVHLPMMKIINRKRREWGLPQLAHVDAANSSIAQIVQMCREFEFQNRTVPPHAHYVGQLAVGRDQDSIPFPWEKLDGRPIIYASLGTIPDERNLKVIQKIVEACVGIDAQLVVGLGQWGADAGVDDWAPADKMPKNAIITGFAPQVKLISMARLVINHAGLNSVNEALSFGVPMISLPRGTDQPGNAARVEASGVGKRASYWGSTPLDLHQMIKFALNDPDMYAQAQAMKVHMHAAGGLKRAADICEQAIATGQPVYRA